MTTRVLHIVTHMERGGLETMIMNYYREIDREKVQFDFLVHRDHDAAYNEEIRSLGGEIYTITSLNPLSPAYYKALNKFFSEHKYDVVHSHLDCMSAYPLRAAKRHGIKVRIAHAHNKNQDKNWKYPIKLISRYGMPCYATNLFACSAEAGRWMFGNHPFNIMKNAIDSKKFIVSEEIRLSEKEKLGISDQFVLGHVGRFNPQKNHEFLVDVFCSVLEKHNNSVLLLVGSGDGKAAIEDKVNKLKIQDKVFFLGERSDVYAFLQAVDVFVFPSLYEGLGIAAVEAQAAGVPCVVSDQVPEECRVIDDFVFLPLKASPKTWAEKILLYRTYDKKDSYEQICAAKFDISQNVEWLEDFYLSEEHKN